MQFCCTTDAYGKLTQPALKLQIRAFTFGAPAHAQSLAVMLQSLLQVLSQAVMCYQDTKLGEPAEHSIFVRQL